MASIYLYTSSLHSVVRCTGTSLAESSELCYPANVKCSSYILQIATVSIIIQGVT